MLPLVKIIAIHVFTIFSLFIVGSCATQNQQLPSNSKLINSIDSIETIFIMPPSVDLTLKTLDGTERWTMKCNQAESDLSSVIAREFTRRGFKVLIISKNDIANGGSEDKTEVSGLANLNKEGFNSDPDKRPTDASERRGDPKKIANKFQNLKKNLQLFATLHGFSRSGGDIVGEVATKTLVSIATLGFVTRYADPTGSASLTLRLVDKTNGEIIWSYGTAKEYYLTGPDFDEKDLAELISIILKNFPRKG
jgi:hypothetical protein